MTATPPFAAEDIARLACEAEPCLRDLPTSVWEPLAQKVVLLRNVCGRDPAGLARVRQAARWMEEAAKPAHELRHLLEKLDRLFEEEGDPQPSIRSLLNALDSCDLVGEPVRQGRPGRGWYVFVITFGGAVERVLRDNGFPRASIASDDGPAAPILAKLVSYLGGHRKELDPLTIARVVRAFPAERTRRNLSSIPAGFSDTSKPYPRPTRAARLAARKEDG